MQTLSSTEFWFIAVGAVITIGLTISVIIAVARIGVAIWRDHSRRNRNRIKPKLRKEIPGLGELEFDYDSKLWSSIDSDVVCVIAGSADGPDPRLIDPAKTIRGSIELFSRTAIEFLVGDAPALRPKKNDFRLSAINFVWEARPDQFVLEFDLAGDLDGMWRVEFENETPRSCGRDD